MDFIQLLKESINQSVSCSVRVQEKKEKFIQILSQDVIDIKQLRKLAGNGIPDEYPQLRSIVWKLLIGFLPTKKKLWNQTYEQYKKNYNDYLKEFIQPKKKEADHPLSKNDNSSWNNYNKDKDLFDEVQKDTSRTRSEMHIFISQIQNPQQIKNVFKKDEKSLTHYEILSRLLFIYAKLNPGIRYVQGMNEIMAPIYYVFLQDRGFLNQEFSYEQETFFSFTLLMGDVRDNFTKSLDNTSQGIKAKLQHFHQLLNKMDPELCGHLDSMDIDPHFYALRWIILCLTQEFNMNDVLRLWDSFLSAENKQNKLNRYDFLFYICIAIVKTIREELLGYDFSQAMTRLQKVDDLDVYELLNKAYEYQKLFNENK